MRVYELLTEFPNEKSASTGTGTSPGYFSATDSKTREEVNHELITKKVRKYYKKLKKADVGSLKEWLEHINKYGFKWARKTISDKNIDKYYRRLKKVSEANVPEPHHIINQITMHVDKMVRNHLEQLPGVEVHMHVGQDDFGEHSGGVVAMLEPGLSQEMDDLQRDKFYRHASQAATHISRELKNSYNLDLQFTPFGFATPSRSVVLSYGRPPKTLLTFGIRQETPTT